MIGIYKLLTKILQGIINLLFVLQIALMILVFLTATYWFLSLISVSAFDFAKPIADSVSEFVHLFYKQDVELGGVFIDGSLLLFDLIAIVIVFGIAKSKYYFHRVIGFLDDLINGCKEKKEERFNKSLQKEVEKNIKKCNNVAVLVQLKAKNMMVDSCWGGDADEGVKEKEDEAFKIFYASIKNITGCKFAKTGDKMLILLNDFENVDNLLSFIDLSINRIRLNMKKKKWLLISYISVDVFDDNTNFKTDVYPLLEKLLTLHIQNEAVCLGNFCMRYELYSEPKYTPFLRGAYDINGHCDVWSLVKKN